MTWHLVDLGPDWRQAVGDGIWGSMPRSWLPRYDIDARTCLDQLLSRVMDAMTKGGSLPISKCGKDGVVTLDLVQPDLLVGRGDRRYGSEGMADFLRRHPKNDLVPMVCGRKAGSVLVLDGHHRMRAYQSVGRPGLALIGEIRSGSGSIVFQSAQMPVASQASL